MQKALNRIGIFLDEMQILNNSLDNGFVSYDEFLEMRDILELTYIGRFR